MIDDCCKDGGDNFNFDLVDLNEVTVLQFFASGENNMIGVTYIKDGVLYFSYSFDCGKAFSSPQQLLSLQGSVTPLQFLAKGDLVVMAFIETIDNKRYKRAVAGSLNPKENAFSFRVCQSSPPSENLNNVSLTFCEDPPGTVKSFDHTFLVERDGAITHNCEGHG
jgi:hypothetical protein